MNYINTQNIKAIAKEYGEEIRGQETRVGSDFLRDIDRLVEQIVCMAVRSQEDDKRITLQSTDWMQRQIKEGSRRTEESK